ncbi:MAG: hypothetical protein DSY76_06925 [Bacteroidetes bacterium]|nr:MAG: hypothetical protein DSY76_06925 [Bacteroidota bacterium]
MSDAKENIKPTVNKLGIGLETWVSVKSLNSAQLSMSVEIKTGFTDAKLVLENSKINQTNKTIKLFLGTRLYFITIS